MRPGILAASDALFSRLQRSRPFFLFAGPNVVESTERCVRLAGAIRDVADRLGLTFVFKASFDKANRTSGCSYRGPGLDGGLQPGVLWRHGLGLERLILGDGLCLERLGCERRLLDLRRHARASLPRTRRRACAFLDFSGERVRGSS